MDTKLKIVKMMNAEKNKIKVFLWLFRKNTWKRFVKNLRCWI